MNLKMLVLKLIKSYRFFSPMFGAKCRYYPTCSEYALELFEVDNFFSALFKSIFRVLRCNQFFKGGIDYPYTKKRFKPIYGKKREIKYWLIPKDDKYIILKVSNG